MPASADRPGLWRRIRGSTPLLVTVIVHAVAIVIAGVFVVQETITNKKRPFAAALPVENVAQRQVEHRVRIARRAGGSSAPSPVSMQRIFSSSPEALALPELPDMPAPGAGAFGGGFSSFGNGAGLGSGEGLGTSLGAGKAVLGLSAINFFGIKKGGRKIVFVVDAGSSMVRPQRGDYPGYERVKSELAKMVGNLAPGTLFNVLVFERSVDAFDKKLVPASVAATEQVFAWIAPYWRLAGGKVGQRGTFRGNYIPDTKDFPSDGGDSRLDLALVSAFEMGADTIFVITDGTPSIQLPVSPQQRAEQKRALETYEREAAAYEGSERQKREMAEYAKAKAAWDAARDKVNADRRKRGLPPMTGSIPGIGPAPTRPGPHKPQINTGYYGRDELLAYLRKRARSIYAEARQTMPSVNIVGYSASEKDYTFIEDLVRAFPSSTARNLGKFDADTKF